MFVPPVQYFAQPSTRLPTKKLAVFARTEDNHYWVAQDVPFFDCYVTHDDTVVNLYIIFDLAISTNQRSFHIALRANLSLSPNHTVRAGL